MSIEPWVSVPDAERAIGFYAEAFGANVLERLEGEHGRVDIAQLSVAGSRFWVQLDPDVRPSGVRFLLMVTDPDAAQDRALAAGAVEVAAVHEEHGWRTGRVTDPFGWDWELSRQLG
jgi:PhnB protein